MNNLDMDTPQTSYEHDSYDPSRNRNVGWSSQSGSDLNSNPAFTPSESANEPWLMQWSSPLPATSSLNFGTLSDFIKWMKNSAISGPFFLKRTQDGQPLGKGAQFEVYGQRHGIYKGKTPFPVDQPYEDQVLQFTKRRNANTKIQVAVKRTLFTLPVTRQESDNHALPLGFGSPAQMRNFRLEVRALCHEPLRIHRNIIKILGWGLDFDPQPNADSMNPISPILFVEHANCSLRDLIKSHPKTIPDSICQKLCLDVCKALAVLHASEIIHGDIKTDNVLVFPAELAESGCIAKLSDFGLSIHEEAKEGATRNECNIGTPGWQAPELSRSDIPVEKLSRCDYFSFGLLVWSVISSDGGCPLKGAERAEAALALATSYLQASQLSDPLKTKFDAIFSSLLQNNPDDRDLSLQGVYEKLSTLEMSRLNKNWAKGRFKRPLESGFIYTPVNPAFVKYDLHSGSVSLKIKPAEPNPSLSSNKENTDLELTSISWNDDFEMFPCVEFYDRTVLVMAYLEGIHEIFRSHKFQLVGEAVGPELSAHDILCLAFSRTGDLMDYKVPAHIYLEEKGLCLLLAARKGSLVAGALTRHFESALPDSVKIDLEWSWGALSCGLVIDWDLYQKDTQRFLKEKQRFRAKGGYNTHYTSPRSRSECLPKNPLAWLKKNHPLHYAAALGNIDNIQQLLDGGSYVDELDARGETPLMKSCMAGCSEATKLLLQHGAKTNISSKSLGTYPLHWLFVFDRSEVSDIADALYTKASRDSINAICHRDIPALYFPFRWPTGTPLEWAVFANNPAAIDKLLEFGVSLDTVRSWYPTMLRYPSHGKFRDDDYLLEHSEALDVMEYQIYLASGTCFHRHPRVLQHPRCQNETQNIQQQRLSAVRFFRKRALDYYGCELNLAIATKRMERVKWLLEHDTDINQYCPTARGTYWHTALCGTIFYDGNIENVRYLLAQGANSYGNMNAGGSGDRCFPLTVAAREQNMDIVRLLVEEYGADVNGLEFGSTNFGANALQGAILGINDPKPLVEYLISKGADVNVESGHYNTALVCAALHSRSTVELCRTLLENGSNINAAGGVHCTALQAAASVNNLKLVEMLVKDYHADINICGGQTDYTPLLATIRAQDNISIALFLLDQGADFTIAEPKTEENPLQAAARLGVKPIVKKLLDLGADPSAIHGKSLKNAVAAGSVKLLRMLIGAGLKLEPDEISVALNAAYEYNHVRMSEFLLEMADDPEGLSKRCTEGKKWTSQLTSTRGGAYEVVMRYSAKRSAQRSSS